MNDKVLGKCQKVEQTMKDRKQERKDNEIQDRRSGESAPAIQYCSRHPERKNRSKRRNHQRTNIRSFSMIKGPTEWVLSTMEEKGFTLVPNIMKFLQTVNSKNFHKNLKMLY